MVTHSQVLLPAGLSPHGCIELATRSRLLATLDLGRGCPDRRLPGALTFRWHQLPDGQQAPVPVVAKPAGAPLDHWLTQSESDVSALLTVFTDVMQLSAGLVELGYRIEQLRPIDVWVEEGRVSWLPAALAWPQRGGAPTGQSLQLAAHSLGSLLRDLLTGGRTLLRFVMVQDELWKLCHELLERGYGAWLGSALAELERLQQRCAGDAERPMPPPSCWVLLDANGLHHALWRQDFDLQGALWSLLNAERASGLAVGRAALPQRWRNHAHRCGLEWLDARDEWAIAAQERFAASGATQLLVLSGKPTDVLPQLARFHPQRGRLAVLQAVQEMALDLPERWEWASWRYGLHHWWRVGDPHRQMGR